MVHHIGNFGGRYATFAQHYSYLFGDQDIVAESVEEIPLSTLSESNEVASLTLESVSFAYPDDPDTNALTDISLAVKQGEKIGIVGKSGSGKSTLIKLLLGFYEPSTGSIMLGETAARPVDLSRSISYVPQDTTLFQESIAYNIGYAVEGKATNQQIEHASKQAHVDQFVRSLKQGYDTLVGERGVKLSLGQRQRIAIARAFLKDTNILVLDEATSSLDSKTEADIQDSLEKLWQGKTVIAIAHRLSTLNNVNRIIVIDKGKIVESGTKRQLLDKNGHFAKLWKQQKDGLL